MIQRELAFVIIRDGYRRRPFRSCGSIDPHFTFALTAVRWWRLSDCYWWYTYFTRRRIHYSTVQWDGL